MFYVDLGAISIHVFDKDCVCTEDIEINETNIILVLNHFGIDPIFWWYVYEGILFLNNNCSVVNIR